VHEYCSGRSSTRWIAAQSAVYKPGHARHVSQEILLIDIVDIDAEVDIIPPG
jgi:hypothetical protein